MDMYIYIYNRHYAWCGVPNWVLSHFAQPQYTAHWVQSMADDLWPFSSSYDPLKELDIIPCRLLVEDSGEIIPSSVFNEDAKP